MSMTAPDRDMLDFILSERSVMQPLTEYEQTLIARRQASIVVAAAARMVENWRRGRPYLFREQQRQEPRARPTLGEVWDGRRRHPVRLGESNRAGKSLLTERT